MRILVINVGSSSVKFSVTDLPEGTLLFKGELAVGSGPSDGALAGIPATLEAQGASGVDAVGHRVAHGGERFREAILIDDAAIAEIEALSALAPLHNPPAVAGIRMTRAAWPGLPQVAVFDTAFHGDMPPVASTYAVPEE